MSVEEIERRSEVARTYFEEGYNCCQAVVLAYADLYGVDPRHLGAIASSFGGGMGRMREVCGAVSGAFMLTGLHVPAIEPKNREERGENYRRVQELAERFKAKNGSIVCRELLGLSLQKEDSMPSERTAEYYKRRPCADYVAIAARLFGESIS